MKKQLVLFLFLISCFCAQAQSYKKTDFGVKTTINTVDVELQFFSNDVVRILKSPKDKQFQKKSFSVIKTPDKIDIQIKQLDNALVLTSKNLEVKLNRQTGKISFFNLEGKLLLSENENGTEFTACKVSEENAFNVKQAFQLTTDEAIYGLGQHQTGKMNQRNQCLVLKQRNMFTAIPYYYSTNGYGLFWDNTSATTFTDSLNVTSFESEIGDCIDYYVLVSKNADQGLALWRNLTGQAPMLPRWVFGFWQSRERYKSQDELVEVVQKYRDLKVPLDGIVQDWQYWGIDNGLWNSTEFGNPKFPNPKKMVDDVHKLNAHIIISVWPSFGNKTAIYDEMKKKNLLFDFKTYPRTNVQVFDVFNPNARDIYWKFMNQNLFSLGMDGWWLDATEPERVEPKPTEDLHKTYFGSFRKVHNAFPIVSTGGVYEHQRQITSDKRVMILTRSAFAGQQRNSTIIWSGDIASRWSVLHNQITNGLNMSYCGIPYWNTDIGGFFSEEYKRGVSDPAYQELYVRWFQFGTFCPMMRSHGTNSYREIYQFGKKGDWAYDVQEKFINLRYRLLPYIYSTSWKITSEAGTFMRPLSMDFSTDKKVLDMNNEYMFGNSFLVCPVTDSLYTARTAGTSTANFDQIKTKKVYLPAGSEWFDFWTGKKIAGGAEIEREVPMSIMPLYVKAGSIVPMGPFVQFSSEKEDSNLEIRIYQGANGAFTLYEDENDNYNYEKGKYATINFKWDDANRKLTIESRKGDFSGMLKTRTFTLILVDEKTGYDIQFTTKPTKTVKYNGSKLVISCL